MHHCSRAPGCKRGAIIRRATQPGAVKRELEVVVFRNSPQAAVPEVLVFPLFILDEKGAFLKDCK